MIRLEIQSNDKLETFQKLVNVDDENPVLGDTYMPVDGLDVTYMGGLAENFTSGEWITLAISLSASVPLNMLAAWIYDQLKNDATIRLVINGNSIKIDEDEIHEVLKIVYKKNEEKKID